MTTLTSPIAKLYKRCARGKHDTCPGSFENWSICSCDCHAGISDTRPAPVSCEDKADAVAEAVAITTTPVVTASPIKSAPKTRRVSPKASGLSTKTDKYAKWANAIVAKNARLEAAWRANQERYGLYLPDGTGFTSVLAPKCEHCGRRPYGKRHDEHSWNDWSVTFPPCGCKES